MENDLEFGNLYTQPRIRGLTKSLVKYGIVFFVILYIANTMYENKIRDGNLSPRQVEMFKDSMLNHGKYKQEVFSFLDDIVIRYPEESKYIVKQHFSKDWKSYEEKNAIKSSKEDKYKPKDIKESEDKSVLGGTVDDIVELGKEFYKYSKEKLKEIDNYLDD